MDARSAGDGHLDDLDLAIYLDGGLDRSERARVEGHLAGCPQCRHEMVESRRLIRAGRWSPLVVAAGGLAAAALIMVALTPALRTRPAQGPSPLRGAQLSRAVVAYGPIAETTDPSPRFIWEATRDAQSYRLTVSRQDGSMLWASSGRDTTRALPDSVPLMAGTTYWWVVDALLADGSTRSTGLHEFRIVHE